MEAKLMNIQISETHHQRVILYNLRRSTGVGNNLLALYTTAQVNWRKKQLEREKLRINTTADYYQLCVNTTCEYVYNLLSLTINNIFAIQPGHHGQICQYNKVGYLKVLKIAK